MTSSDVMTTMYNHQSVICLLEFVEKIQRDASELQTIFSSPRSPPPSYESDVTEESVTSTEYSTSPVRSQHQHFRTNIKSMPYLALKSKSMLGKGQIYLPKEGFKRAFSWAEGVVNERVLEPENQQKKIEQLLLNLLFHPQLKHYVRQNITTSKNSTETTSGRPRSKPLETKKSKERPLQKVAPHYVKKVVAEVVESIEDDQVKKEKKWKGRPHSMTRMGSQTKSKATQVEFDIGRSPVDTEETATQYEDMTSGSEGEYREKVEICGDTSEKVEICGDHREKVEKVEICGDHKGKVEISRVLLSGTCCNSNITNFVSNRLEKLGVTEEVWDLFQLVLDDVNSSINESKK